MVGTSPTIGTSAGALLLLSDGRLVSQNVAGSFVLPANAVLRDILVRNTTANAVTGGIKFGTTAGATDVVAALAVAANGLSFVTDALLLKRYFSSSATQSIFFDAVVAWNSASVQIDFIYYQL